MALTPTASADQWFCPNCRRLAAPTPAAAPPTVPAARAAPGHPDRRVQELLAAWVSAQPVPCPKCRTPLRHRGLGRLECPSCGEAVDLGISGGRMTAESPAADPDGTER